VTAGNIILFPGQGAQYVGMAKLLVERFASARHLFDKTREVLGFDLLDICINGPVERLNATDISQPAIFVSSLAALESLRLSDADAVDHPKATAGLSLGEYTALAFAGVFSFEDGLSLVKTRGEAMQAAAIATPSAMASVLLIDRERLESICQSLSSSLGIVSIANYLCPGNLVVSGVREAVSAVEESAQAAGAKTVRLAVAGAFHTPIMQPAVEKLIKAMASIKFMSPRIPVWSNVTGKPHSSDPNDIAAHLARQVVEPVLWEDSIQGMLGMLGDHRFFEVGPGKVLTGLMKRIQRKAECVSIPA